MVVEIDSMIKKITGTRSQILVEFENKTIVIEGELTLSPAFYAIKESIRDRQNPETELSTSESEEIINEILQYNKTEFPIIFED